MHKTFMGVRLKTLREERSLTQAALAQALKLSPSYLNQIENNQRPLTVPVLLRLQTAFGVDLQFFSEDEEARLTAELREVLADASPRDGVPLAEVRSLAQQMPGVAQALVRLHWRCRTAEERLAVVAAGIDGERDAYLASAPLQPYEEVRDFFYARHNHMAVLDERAERLFEHLHVGTKPARSGNRAVRAQDAGGDLAALLERHLAQAHGVTTLRTRPDVEGNEIVRAYDPQTRTMQLSGAIEPGQRAFHLATQVARLEAADLIETFTSEETFRSDEARSLARIGFANYFAGALVLPYRRFLS